MKSPIVLLDACVLFPAPFVIFDEFSFAKMFLARWTNEIHAGMDSNVLEMRPDLTETQLNRTKDLMNRNIRDCLVENYEHLIETVNLPG